MYTVESFLKNYLSALREENAAVFAGAGLSIPTGMVDWRGLLRGIAKDVGLDVDRENDLISVAQFHVNERGGRYQINQTLVTEFAERATLTENHRLLASLPISTYWTTNYDALLEQALRNAHKRPDVKSTNENLSHTLPRRDAVIYKMHGDASQPDKAVLTRGDYEAYEETHRLFLAALQGDLVSKTFLFIGFSFNDPNLNYVLSRIRLALGENRRDHYCLLKKVTATDFKTSSEFEYAKARQELQVRDLRRYGIIGLLLDTFSEHTDLLRKFVTLYRRGRVFVSGSGEVFEPWSPTEAQSFIRDLGQKLIQGGFDLVSGFGHGLGSSLLNGVLDGLEMEGSFALHDRVILRPFPHGDSNPLRKAARWVAYRKEMVSHAGIALFLFGNKPNLQGKIELASGVNEEFNLAVEAGLAVVPVGATGYMASQLHKRVIEDFAQYYPGRDDLRSEFEALGNCDDRTRIAERVINFLLRLKEDG